MDREQRARVLTALRDGFDGLRPPLQRLRAALVETAKAGGLAAVRVRYDRLVQDLWLHHRHDLMVAVARRVAAARVDALRRAAREAGEPIAPHSPAETAKAIERILRRRGLLGPVRWSPRDTWVKVHFLSALAAIEQRFRQRNLRAKLLGRIEAASGTSGLDDPFEALKISIDPRFKKIEYPMGLDDEALDPVDAVERAADTWTVARGQFWAEVGMRDMARAVDTAVGQALSQDDPSIIGWRLVLSPDHTETKCPSGICRDLTEYDAGHPAGPGVFWDAFLPSTHPNCWCDWQPVWASEAPGVTDDDLEPPDDYADRLREFLADHGVTLYDDFVAA